MFIFSSSFSMILLGIVLLGAYKCWMGVTHVLSKTFFHQTEEAHVKKIAFITVGISVLLMVAPLLVPTALGFKEAVGVLYMIYVGTSLWQIYSWYQVHFGKKSDSTSNDKSAK